MWVAELHCAQGHGFEGFFGSKDDFDDQQRRQLVSCPVCGSLQVARKLSAPRLNLGAEPAQPAAKPADRSATAALPDAAQLREWISAVHARAEDLGPGFVDEARRIHAGQAPDRLIRGQATPQQRAELQDEGIAVLLLPDPASLTPTH